MTENHKPALDDFDKTGTLIIVLERLVCTALGVEGIEMLVVRDGCSYRVALSLPSGAASALLGADAQAVFRFTRDRVQGLVGLGVEVPKLAQSAFGDLIDQLAAHAPDRVAFMRAIHGRLVAAHAVAADTVT